MKATEPGFTVKRAVLPNVPGHHVTPEQLERWEKIHDTILKGPHAELQRMFDSEECWHGEGFGHEVRAAMKSGAIVFPKVRLRDSIGTIVPFFGDVVDEVGSSGSVANAEAFHGASTVGEVPGSSKAHESALQPEGHDDRELRAPDYDSGRKPEGQVWNAEEMERDFQVLSYLAPYVTVFRRSDGVVGSLEFIHEPRVYWDFRHGSRNVWTDDQ